MNEPFGDTVNWDALPANAIASVTLMPGSNPLFGLNALGGAVSLQTKTGFSHPGHGARFSAGRSAAGGPSCKAAGTSSASVPTSPRPAGSRKTAGAISRRRASAGVRQRRVASDRSRARGDGDGRHQPADRQRPGARPAASRRIAGRSSRIPDETKTDIGLILGDRPPAVRPGVDLEARRLFPAGDRRHLQRRRHAYDECERGVSRSFCARKTAKAAGARPLRPPDCRTTTATRSTPRTTRPRRAPGLGRTAQATVTRPTGGRDNHFVAGASFDGARSRYDSDTELALLTDTRGTIGAGIFDGEAAVRLRTSVRHVARSRRLLHARRRG